MNQDAMGSKMGDDEIDFWELLRRLKTGWQWLAVGGLIGFMGALGVVTLAPAQYEATAIIQPAAVGTIAPTIEPVAQTLERLKFATFYVDDVVKACQTDSAQKLARDVKASLVKGNTLIALSYRADSATLTRTCMAKIVAHLIKSQEAIAAPLIKELEDQRAATKQRIDYAERPLRMIEKRVVKSLASTDSMQLMLRREELMRLEGLYRDQRIQLSEPLTHSMKLLEPIHASDNAVFPKKLISVVIGLIGGAFAGLLSLFVDRSRRRFEDVTNKVS